MNPVLYLLPLTMLAMMAWQDYRTRKISDFLISSFWMSILIIQLPLESYYVAVFYFGFFYCLTAFLTTFQIKMAKFGWADILMLPPYFAIYSSIPPLFPLSFAAVGGFLFTNWLKKREVAVAPFLFIFLSLGLILKMVIFQ